MPTRRDAGSVRWTARRCSTSWWRSSGCTARAARRPPTGSSSSWREAPWARYVGAMKLAVSVGLVGLVSLPIALLGCSGHSRGPAALPPAPHVNLLTQFEDKLDALARPLVDSQQAGAVVV